MEMFIVGCIALVIASGNVMYSIYEKAKYYYIYVLEGYFPQINKRVKPQRSKRNRKLNTYLESNGP